jgi:hypothetical protein
MATCIRMMNPQTRIVKDGYVGFSWTYLFFGWWVPLFRGELSVAALHFLFSLITLGLWQIVAAFLYNKQYMLRLIENRGYVISDSPYLTELAERKLGISS